MKSISYLFYKSAKNFVLELKTKPGKLVLYLLILVVIAFSLASPSPDADGSLSRVVDLRFLKGFSFLYLLLFMGTLVGKGLSSGSSLFEMNDVNFLFVSPVSPKMILLYGVLRQTKTAILAGFFLLFQGSTMKNLFGQSISSVFLLWGVFTLGVVVTQLLSLFIYSVSNGNDGRKRFIKILIVLCFAPLAVSFLLAYLPSLDASEALWSTLGSPALSLVPIAGWCSEALYCFFTGNAVGGLLWLLPNILAAVALVLAVMLGRSDYYEDVLVATETAFEKKRAAAEGNIQSATLSDRRISVRQTGLGGSGASAFLFKHLRESRRENRMILSLSNWLLAAMSLVLALLLREDYSSVGILYMMMWIQVFLIGTSKGLKELYSPPIFLVPDRPLAKILYSNAEALIQVLIQSLLIFVPSGIVFKTDAPIVALCIFVFVMFSFMLIGINYVSMRFTGSNMSAGILILIYFIATAIVLAPGLVASIALAILLPPGVGLPLGLLVLALWELLVGLVCLFVSKGILHRTDMPTTMMIGQK